MKTRYASGIEPGLEKQDVAAGLLLALAGLCPVRDGAGQPAAWCCPVLDT